jgi:hypothetical protein
VVERSFERSLADREPRFVRFVSLRFMVLIDIYEYRFSSLVDMLEDIMQASMPRFIVSNFLPALCAISL